MRSRSSSTFPKTSGYTPCALFANVKAQERHALPMQAALLVPAVDRLGADVVLDEDAGKERGKIKDGDVLVQAGLWRDHQAAVLFYRLDKRRLEALRVLRLFGYDRRPYAGGVHHGGVHEAVFFPCHAVQRHHAPLAPGREHGKALSSDTIHHRSPATALEVADLLPVYGIKAHVRAL